MLHDRRKGHGKWPGKLAHGNALMLVELREKRPPRGVREGGERAVENPVLILNHVVKYRHGHPPVKPVVEIARKFESDHGMFYQHA
jgi:hypothetical protein